jgi:hypothetical protein
VIPCAADPESAIAAVARVRSLLATTENQRSPLVRASKWT